MSPDFYSSKMWTNRPQKKTSPFIDLQKYHLASYQVPFCWVALSNITYYQTSIISLPRYTGSKDAQLICFCDASTKAYAAAIYLKPTIDGTSKVNLIFSKSRIAPKKSMSIPRLELLALLIGVRSLKFIAKELGLKNCKKLSGQTLNVS